ncbi:urease accessory protein [Bradyrhizobium japonicum]|uniref:HupE/UreJ family protein n=1 Tax=Bradyrhizobium TaxID=374 RepID=UPI00048726CF|nr:MULTISPECIES: HupE/UreJ family protein [Bradyrhizobium]MBR0879796.1 HupE/UreJ family protein [Bradyrhizobium liaoningense]MBR0942816.1 HupE/UreJ family protein [Bradyrhizobium liaoningense]MBR1000015.1 HupE/UreJ family protein [Bradyrhizobium liaoningense]MBR1028917.1 HupE/UreJ family protein [Bradyrhizobium liaoningense]MBR1067166.1 HupE/UreJ family protein [Bradyrhizobium liaoningense]
MKLNCARLLMATAMLLAGASTAEAHIVAARLGDFYMGVVHPLTDLQDVVLWTATGVLAGTLGAAKGRWLIAVFPLGLLVGLSLGQVFSATSTQLSDAAMMLAIGLLLAAAAQVPTFMLCAIAFAVAVIRSAANGADLGPETDRLLFAAGLACVGYGAITLAMALTAVFTNSDGVASWRTIAVRALGGWIAAIGLMMASLVLAS